MEKMTEAEWRAFVSAGTRTGKAAIVRADGGPHVTPIWFVLDGDDLVFTTVSGGQKERALRRDPRLAICVDDQEPPYSYVMLQGTTTLSADPDELLKWATVLGGRYMGPGRAAEFGERNAAPGEYLVRLHITKVIAHRDIAG
jgi:PPOX class probable F420-dependent enzyme